MKPSLLCERLEWWVSPYINHFISADTIVPGYGNPQALNRYSYVSNNPLRYTDPTGRMQAEDTYSSSNGTCKASDKSCNWVGKSNDKKGKKDKPKGSSGQNDCTTVTCKALQGEPGAIVDLFVPTHFGWRGQFELSATLLQIFGGAGVGPSGTLGVNIAYNRVSGELAGFADWTVEGGGSIGSPLGGALTEGPIIGWGSSTIKDVAQGNSGIISGTVAYEGALSAGISVPIDGDSLRSISPHIDPVYGQIPATAYMGGGIGGVYGGLGGGGSHVFASGIIDLFP